MTKMSDLSKDLVGEILWRIPMASLRTVRSTCKTWNDLSKNRIPVKATAPMEQFMGFIMMNSKVCSVKFNLQGIRDEDDFLDPSIKQVDILDQVEISKAFHFHGLLLCVLKDNSKLLVWNPYLGQIRWIHPKKSFHGEDIYALGCDINRNHKILRFVDYFGYDDQLGQRYTLFGFEIYDFNTNLWRVLDVTPDWVIQFYQRGVTLKGNTYFFAQDKFSDTEDDFLLCFNFTTETFGPRLPLPFQSCVEETVTLSCVRDDEQLSVLYQRLPLIDTMEIWITTNIEPNVVSWSMLMRVNTRPLTGFQFEVEAGSFFIDEKKKVVVVFDLDRYDKTQMCRHQTAYIIGRDGYYKHVSIGEAPNLGKPKVPVYCLPLVCSSYAPSLVQLQTNRTGKRKARDY